MRLKGSDAAYFTKKGEWAWVLIPLSLVLWFGVLGGSCGDRCRRRRIDGKWRSCGR